MGNLINKDPFDLHLAGYQFCVPNTKLGKPLAGQEGINPLDKASCAHNKFNNQSQSSVPDRSIQLGV